MSCSLFDRADAGIWSQARWDAAKMRFTPPLSCEPLITQQAALRCMRHRSVAFMGYSQIRYLGVAFAQFLWDPSNAQQASKLDKLVQTKAGSLLLRPQGQNGISARLASFPHNFGEEKSHAWRADVYSFELAAHWPSIEAVLVNGSRRHDFVLVSRRLEASSAPLHAHPGSPTCTTAGQYIAHTCGPPHARQLNLGLHELASPHGKRRAPTNHSLDYAARMLRVTPLSGVHVAWMPMTTECPALLIEKLVGRYSLATAEARTRQPQLVDAVNSASLAHLANRSNRSTSPLWWNANAPLPRRAVCELSADGVHLQQWVTSVLARLLLMDLCRRWAQ